MQDNKQENVKMQDNKQENVKVQDDIKAQDNEGVNKKNKTSGVRSGWELLFFLTAALILLPITVLVVTLPGLLIEQFELTSFARNLLFIGLYGVVVLLYVIDSIYYVIVFFVVFIFNVSVIMLHNMYVYATISLFLYIQIFGYLCNNIDKYRD